jgi:HPt (histidine-containing phosphotransfer) domain-containing protein
MKDALKEFRANYERIAELMDAAAAVADEAPLADSAASAGALRALAASARNFHFKIAVIGEFSTGKSTLLNALIGRALLPAKMPPCTAAPVSIGFAERDELLVFYKNNLEPERRDLSHLKELITLKHDGAADIARERQQSTLDRLVLGLPQEICRNGVRLYDTPGLNENGARSEITYGVLPEMDAAIVLSPATKLLADTERSFLSGEARKEPGDRRWMDAAFFVVTFADVAHDDGPLDELRGRLDGFCDKLLPEGFAPGRRFFVDSKATLRHRTGSADSRGRFDFDQFETALKRFLVDERGTAGLRSQRMAARRALDRLIEQIDAGLHSLQSAAQRDTREIATARERLSEERARVGRMTEGMRSLGSRFARDLANRFRADARRWIDFEFPAALEQEEYPETILLRLDPPTNWFAAKAAKWLEEKIQHWTNEVPPGDFKELLERFEHEYKDDFAQLKENLGAIGKGVGLTSDFGVTDDDGAIDWLFRSAVGMFSGGPLGILVGSTLGWKGVMTNVAVNLGLGLAAAVVGLSVPVVGWAVAAAAIAAIQIIFGQDGIQRRIREKVIAGFRAKMPAKIEEFAAQIEARAGDEVGRLADQIEAAGNSLIAHVAHAVDDAAAAAQMGDSERARTREGLAAARSRIAELGELLMRVG